MRRSLLTAAALGAVVLAWALPMQSPGCGQNAHYAATRSFAERHPDIDRYVTETCDVVHRDGHYYAAKGPAMDFWSAPWYRVLNGLGAVPANPSAGRPYPEAMAGVPLRALWQIGLWAVVLPGIALLLLVRRTADALEPGTGTAAAVVLGLGTLVLPFSTMLFAHVPATALVFAAFVLLFRRPGWRAALAAGVCAGLAVSADLPLAVPAAGLALYAAAQLPRAKRAGAYVAGLVVGLVPIFAFGIWAFGSPFELAYSGAAIDPGAGGREQADVHGLFYTLTSPHPRLAVEMLLSQRGLLVLSPVLAAAAFGVYLLWRRGLRAEAGFIAALAVVEVAWNAFRPSYELALGGWVPGPRFLIPLLPFLCAALAPAIRRAPLTVAALAAVSIAAMVVATSAEPLLSNDDTRHWLSRIGHGNFANTVVSLSGVGHGWIAILPFFALVVAGVLFAGAATRVRVERVDLVRAAAVLAAWLLVEHAAPELLRVDRATGQAWGTLAALLLAAAAVWAAVRLRPEGLILLPLATVKVAGHTKLGLLLALAALAALALVPRLRPAPGPA